MNEPEHEAYELILEFDSDCPEFARGFDMGLLVGSLNDLDEGRSVRQTVFTSNAEMVMRVAQYADCTFTCDDELTDISGVASMMVTLTKN